MILLARKLRHRLLAENRLSKYLLYAIGEIVLVVIGILQMVQLTTGKPVDTEKLFGVELQNSFAIALRLMGEKGAIYNRAIREIDTTLKQIEAELSQLN